MVKIINDDNGRMTIVREADKGIPSEIDSGKVIDNSSDHGSKKTNSVSTAAKTIKTRFVNFIAVVVTLLGLWFAYLQVEPRVDAIISLFINYIIDFVKTMLGR